MKNILYCKYTNDRSQCFKIKTVIYEEDKQKRVQKSCISNLGKTHIENIYKNYQILSSVNKYEDIKINQASYHDNTIEFEYIEGETLTKLLNEAVKKREYETFKIILENYKRILILGQPIEEFVITEEFEKLFGKISFPRSMRAIRYTNIDLSFDNIIMNDILNVYDYEWVFNFSIPLEYIIYRAIKYYLVQLNQQGLCIDIDLWDYMGIIDEDKKIFEEMECAFYNYIRGNYINIRELSELWGFNQTTYSLKKMLDCTVKATHNEGYQVFYDYGNDFNEDNSYKKAYGDFINQSTIIRIPLNGKEKRVRFDPAFRDCIMNIDYICVYDRGQTYEPKYVSNANYVRNNTMFFATDDPQIILQDIDYTYASYVEIQMEISYLSRRQIYKIINRLSKIDLLQNSLANLRKDTQEQEIIIEQQQQLIQELQILQQQVAEEVEELKKEISYRAKNEDNLIKLLNDNNLENVSLNTKIKAQLEKEMLLIQEKEKMNLKITQLELIQQENISKLQEYKEESNRQKALINAIYDTKAWKLAEKLRKIKRCIKSKV